MTFIPTRLSGLRSKILPALAVFLLLSAAPLATAAPERQSRQPVPAEVAARFGLLMTQNVQGRIQPVDTYASELLRKIYHKKRYGNLNADQMLLHLVTDPEYWSRVPLIYVNDRSLRDRFGADGKYVSYDRFFDSQGRYRLAGEVESAYQKPPRQQTKADKALLKLDEKINLMHGLFSRQLLPLFPLEGGTRWLSAGDHIAGFPVTTLLPAASAIDDLTAGLANGNPGLLEKSLEQIREYQRIHTAKQTVSPAKLTAEIRYNRADIFRNCFRLYLILGFLYLSITFTASRAEGLPATASANGEASLPQRRFVNSRKRTRKKGIFGRTVLILILLTFLWHTVGLGLRWYISERGPWTNAYETMVYVAWICVLGGLLFQRRMPFVTAVGTLMAGVILFVSNLHWLDPQITPLVPVLKSPWLMIHVSVITASYGFFGISAALGLTTLIQLCRGRRTPSVRMMNELCMWIGLILLTAGIFFGAVWANESWGRYWGWDPKETWALITMLYYALTTHARFIPGLNNDYLFSVLSVFGLGIVLMTFFGVNYLLSGLHSYGYTGGIALLPICIATAFILILTGLAGWNFYRKN